MSKRPLRGAPLDRPVRTVLTSVDHLDPTKAYMGTVGLPDVLAALDDEQRNALTCRVEEEVWTALYKRGCPIATDEAYDAARAVVDALCGPKEDR